jgi:diguanylate cyclase (GGDEF)-like protein
MDATRSALARGLLFGAWTLAGGYLGLLALGASPAVLHSAFLASLGCAAAAVSARAVTVAGERAAWAAMAAALWCWLLGALGYALADDPAAVANEPSLEDVFFALFYPAAALACVLLLRARAVGLPASAWLDGVVVGLGAAGAAGIVAGSGLDGAVSPDPVELVLDVVFPVGDVLVMGLAGVALFLGRRCGETSWRLLGGGLALSVLADAEYSLELARGTFAMHGISYVAWLLGLLLVARSACAPATRRRVRLPSWHPLLPAAAAGCAIAVLTAGSLVGVHPEGVPIAAAAATVAVVRLVMSLRELRRLAASAKRSRTDDLTGLPNRRELVRWLDERTAAEVPLALLLVDVDGFRELNDSLGHQVGDGLLRGLGIRLAAVVGVEDGLAHLGGDEFAVLLAGATDADAAIAAARRLTGALEEPFLLDGVPVQVDASIGIALPAGQAAGTSDLLRHADVALSAAKRLRSGLEVYRPEQEVHARDGVALVGQLRAGIPRGELEVHYQPQVRLADGRLAAVEALVRWRHPERGLLAPGVFLPRVANTPVMRALTARVIGDALRDAAAWRAGGLDVPVAVNVCAHDLQDPGFAAAVSHALAATGARPGDLRIEVTEDEVMQDLPRAVATLSALRSLGIGLSVDDFGTGQSSLARLRDLPVDELKIDRSFVFGATTDGVRDRAIVRAAITLGHDLGLAVVAEGVETPAAWEALRGLGCDLAQGYGIARPMPAAELAEWGRAWVLAPPAWATPFRAAAAAPARPGSPLPSSLSSR